MLQAPREDVEVTVDKQHDPLQCSFARLIPSIRHQLWKKKKTKAERCGGARYAMMGFVCLVCALADTPDAPDGYKLCKLSVCRSVTGRVERTSTSGKNCQ
jgi:hypothetical protein